jgi:putative cell wall-binding protein
MTLLLPDTPAAGTVVPARPRDLPARLATRTGWLLRGRDDRGRRSFLRRAAIVGTALAVNPVDFILRPGTAYAQVCGPSNECSQGWSAFCCTINAGANTCPTGSYVAGWWKVSSSAFCRGEDRYVVDCNRLPDARCSCRCADGSCDRRRVCCNNFRYGQCNQQIRGTTEVVCRIVICTPPWEWDTSCTTTVRTDERTRDHNSSCLNGPNPTEIAVVYQDLGLVGSILGARVGDELAGPDGGSWQRYANGVITRSTTLGIAVVAGPVGLAYADLGGPDSPLGYVADDPVDLDGGQVLPTQFGALYTTPAGAVLALHGPVHDEHLRRGGPTGWLGFPLTGLLEAPGGRIRVDFAAGWSLVHDPSTGEVRLLPVDVELPDAPGEWPDTAGVTRWQGDTRVLTAVQVSREVRPQGAGTAVLAAADGFADALAGGVLAAVRGGPVLLTGRDGLDPAAAEELRRLGVDEVVLVGGESVLSAQVEADLARDVPDAAVSRLAGESRFATAAAVSQALTAEGTAELVYVTSGRDFPDALSASPAAGRAGAPLLLVEPGDLPEATAAELRRLEPAEVVIVGGPAAVSQDVLDAIADLTGAEVRRIAGESRFDTAVAVTAEAVPGTTSAVLLATGEAFADALAAGTAAALVHAPLLLVTGVGTPGATRRAIERLEPDLLVVVGGPAAVSDVTVDQLGAIPTGPYVERAAPAPQPGSEPEPELSPAEPALGG